MTERFSQRQIDEVRARWTLSELVAHDVRLIRRGRDFVGLCPFHNEKTPSFTVADVKGFYHCFGCGAHGDVIAWRMQMNSESFAGAMASLLAERPDGIVPVARRVARRGMAPRERSESDVERRRRAAAMWSEAQPAAGTPAAYYLASRGLILPVPPTLRFHPAIWHPFAGAVFPALLARVTSCDGDFRGVWRIYLDPRTAGKAPVDNPKLGLGAQQGGSVHLSPSPLQATRLDTGEGIETMLGVLQRYPHLAVWASLSTGGLRKAALPSWAEELVIWADMDAPDERAVLVSADGRERPNPALGKRPGTVAAEDIAARARREGRRVAIIYPGAGDGTDFRDVFAA